MRSASSSQTGVNSPDKNGSAPNNKPPGFLGLRRKKDTRQKSSEKK